jgi:hypothetical protein
MRSFEVADSLLEFSVVSIEAALPCLRDYLFLRAAELCFCWPPYRFCQTQRPDGYA